MTINRSHISECIPSGFLERLFWILSFFAVIIAVGAAFAFWQPHSVIIPIGAEDIHPLGGNAYATVLPSPKSWLPMSYRGDTYGFPDSRLKLLENGQSFGTPHASQASIESKGAGRYLHLRAKELYFSTLDNSDPRTNGRTYEVIVAVTPESVVVKGVALIALGLMVFGLARHRASSEVCAEGVGKYVPHIFFGAIAFAWLVLIWAPAPLVIDSGDGGNVASIVAGWLDRARFVNDPVFSDSSTSRFYMTLAIPLTMLLTKITHDVGQAYVLMIFPIIWFQSVGFYRLGMMLFVDRFWATLLGLLSIPPVYVFSGELWGLLGTPLTRGLFSAVFPWLLLLFFQWRGAFRDTLLLMIACGFSLYLHPVSAPSVALAIWIVLLMSKPFSTSWFTHGARFVAAGVLFVVICLPFAMTFALGFPSSSDVNDPGAAGLAGQLLASSIGPQYYEVHLAIRQFIEGGGSGLPWGWTEFVWLTGIVGFIFLDHICPEYQENVRRLRLFVLALVFASAGLCFIDQAFAHLFGRQPIQVDLIRNIRYLVPCMFVFAVWLLVAISRKCFTTPIVAPLVLAIGVAVTVSWWVRFPTPFTRAVEAVLSGDASGSAADTQNREVVRRIAKLPPDSLILPLVPRFAEGPGELVGLAVRYGAFQPVAYLPKDLNFMAYSGSGRLNNWVDSNIQFNEIVGSADSGRAREALITYYSKHNIKYVLAYSEEMNASLSKALAESSKIVDIIGPWQLLLVDK